MGPGDRGQMGASTSGTLRTRSHSRADPPWALQDMLILVNEIAVVEGDCQKALSTYQKWSMIAENCTALDVVRNSNQCRRKWESLLSDYKLVKNWEENSEEDSYWSLGFEQRREIGLPKDLDKELFEAIDNFTKLQDQADTDPDDDPEAAEIDVDAGESGGSKHKRVRRRSTLPKKPVERRQPNLMEELEKPISLDEKMEQVPTEECKPKRPRHQSTLQKGKGKEKRQPMPMLFGQPNDSLPVAKETEQEIPMYSKPKRSRHHQLTLQNVDIGENEPQLKEELIKPVEEMVQVASNPKPKGARSGSNPKKAVSKGKKQPEIEEELEKSDTSVLGKIKGNTELIHTILAGDLSENLDDERDDDAAKIARVRIRAEKLISCLVDLAKNLEQLSNGVEEC